VVSQTVGYGVLFYALPVLLLPMQHSLELTRLFVELPRIPLRIQRATDELRQRRYWMLTAAFAALTMTCYSTMVLLSYS